MSCISNTALGVSASAFMKVSQHISSYSYFIHKKMRFAETNTLSQSRLLLLPGDKVKLYRIHMPARTLSIYHPTTLE